MSHALPPTAAPRMRGAAARALALSKIAARSPPTRPPMEEAPVTRRLVVLGKERTVVHLELETSV